MAYPLLLTAHLFAALMFIGTVFFEVLMLERVRRLVPEDTMRTMERAIGTVARQLMPWVILVLFTAGIGMAWFHRQALAAPWENSFALLLWLKIILATSVFGHFVTAMVLMRTGRMRARHSQRIHYSVFVHVVLIVLLAKGMFFLHW